MTTSTKFSLLRSIREKKIFVGFSGGLDSVVAAVYLKSRGHEVTLAFQDHGNEYSRIEAKFLYDFCDKYGFSFLENWPPERKFSTSKEANWRKMRYDFFHSLDAPVVTGHHLSDATETFLMTAFRGEGHFMEYRNKNVIRPFLVTERADMLRYALENKLTWLEDPTNFDVEFTPRNKIRHRILPLALEINPGLHSTVKRNIIRKTSESEKLHATNTLDRTKQTD